MRRVGPAIALFFVAPLVAEFLLGNLPITMLPATFVLAPMYGGGALLIREVARRTGRGWAAILTLGLAYAVIEEAFTTQTLFNPNYLTMNMHLLDPAYMPRLGMGGAWTVFVLTLHVAWSVGVSIALVEALVPDRRTAPWLGPIGLGVVAVLFAAGIAATTAITLHGDTFVASPRQFAAAAAVVIALVVSAFVVRVRRSARSGAAPPPWAVGTGALAAGSLFLVVPMTLGWTAVGIYLALEAAAGVLLWRWSGRESWTPRHVLAAAGGAALAYGWHAFPQPPVLGASPTLDFAGNVVFLLALVALLYVAEGRTRTG